MKRISISIKHMTSRYEDELKGDSLFEKGIVGIWVEQIVLHRLYMEMVLGLYGFGLLHLEG